MRAKRAKALRPAERPNPGRKHGGADKVKPMKSEPVPMAAKKGKESK